MARKSRKETVAVIAPEVDSTCRAAIYVRLSVEDSHTRSASIETQQLIIARFLEQNPEITVYNTYIDNGATGTNFHRPGFQQMLSDIEAGHVNCVIVKDLSRLGRNTIDTGYYIEQYFRIRNIRFIAVNENYDTAAPEDAHSGIIIPLRNMINEAYALDIGRKIRAQQRQAMKDGKFIGARTPYGYLKAKDDCHQLIIDPVAAVVVQKMFQWAHEGAGLNTIAVRLNEEGFLPPSHYKKTQGTITHENLLGNGKWQTRTVGVILRSEVYTGDLVQGQTKTVDHRQVKADADEWTIVRGTHEAIISREQFDAVQKILDQTAQRAKAREVIFLDQLRAALERALQRLPEAEGDAIRGKYFEGRELSRDEKNAEHRGMSKLLNPALHAELLQYIEDRTPYYLRVGVQTQRNTGESAVEKIVFKREALRRKVGLE